MAKKKTQLPPLTKLELKDAQTLAKMWRDNKAVNPYVVLRAFELAWPEIAVDVTLPD